MSVAGFETWLHNEWQAHWTELPCRLYWEDETLSYIPGLKILYQVVTPSYGAPPLLYRHSVSENENCMHRPMKNGRLIKCSSLLLETVLTLFYSANKIGKKYEPNLEKWKKTCWYYAPSTETKGYEKMHVLGCEQAPDAAPMIGWNALPKYCPVGV